MIRRGEIWWADLGEPRGSSPGFRRPVLIVQDDAFNASRIATTMAVVITSNLALSAAPGNVLLPKSATHLPRDSVANVSQVVTLDKRTLTERVCKLPKARMTALEEGLRMALGLG